MLTFAGGFIVIIMNGKYTELTKNLALKIEALQSLGCVLHLNPGDVRDGYIVNIDSTTAKGNMYVLQTK